MLNRTVVTETVAGFFAITFTLCVAYGLLAPARFHASWLLEALLPGFTWLTITGFVIGLAETALYGAWAGLLFSTLYNYFTRKAAQAAEGRGRAVRAA